MPNTVLGDLHQDALGTVDTLLTSLAALTRAIDTAKLHHQMTGAEAAFVLCDVLHCDRLAVWQSGGDQFGVSAQMAGLTLAWLGAEPPSELLLLGVGI